MAAVSRNILPTLPTIQEVLARSSSDFSFLDEPANKSSRIAFCSFIVPLLFGQG